MKPSKEKTVTSIVLSNFFCTEKNTKFGKNQFYESSFQRVEEIQLKGNFLKIIKIE